jgi:uncharacterized membrane protein YqhA
VNVFPISTTVRPVTQLAEVIVKIASINLIGFFVEIGNISNEVPMVINMSQLNKSILSGVSNL